LSWFTDYFGAGRKPQTVSYQGIQGLGEIGVAEKEWLPELLKRTRTEPEEWSGKYYDELFQPTAKQMRSEWGEQVEAPAMQVAGAMGSERGSHTLGNIAKETARREMELGKYGGELRTKGFETGLERQREGMAGLQDYVGMEAALRQKAALANLEQSRLTETAGQQYGYAQRERLPMAVEAGGQLAGVLGGDWFKELLSRPGAGGTSKIGGGTFDRATAASLGWG